MRLFFALLHILIMSAGFAQAGSIEDLYMQAVEDTRIAEHSEISRNLIGIATPDEKNSPPLLQWKQIDGASYVLVCSWAGKYIESKQWEPGKSYTLSRTDNFWVTVVPELQNFYASRGFWPDDQKSLVLRTKQLLGLPATEQMTVLVEFWVKPGDLFRPCPDSDPSDHEAQLEYPWKRSAFQKFDPDMKIHQYAGKESPEVIYNYKQWYENLNATTYTGDNPYPWTQLGYTYDWSDDGYNNNHVGLSEFIVLGGAQVVIERLISTDNLGAYFAK